MGSPGPLQTRAGRSDAKTPTQATPPRADGTGHVKCWSIHLLNLLFLEVYMLPCVRSDNFNVNQSI